MAYLPLNPDQLHADFNQAPYVPTPDVGRRIVYRDPPGFIGQSSVAWAKDQARTSRVPVLVSQWAPMANGQRAVAWSLDVPYESPDQSLFMVSAPQYNQGQAVVSRDGDPSGYHVDSVSVAWSLAELNQSLVGLAWQTAQRHHGPVASVMCAALQFDAVPVMRWFDAERGRWYVPAKRYLPLDADALDVNFSQGHYRPEFISELANVGRSATFDGVTSVVSQVADQRNGVGFAGWGTGERRYRVFNGTVSTEFQVEPTDLEVPTLPMQPIWIIMNTLECVTLPDGVPLELSSVTIQGGRDAWYWSLNATLWNPLDIERLKPSLQGRTRLQITVNGHVFVFDVDGFSRRRAFGQNGYSITGVSQTAVAGAPYAAASTGKNAALTNVSQLADAALAGSGISADWQAVNWNLSAGQYQYVNQSPVQQLQTLATAAGAFVGSDFETPVIRIQPHYKIKPWQWSAQNADLEIPVDVVQSESVQWQSNPNYNQVLVQGVNQGVQVLATRAGTAGDVPANDVLDSLMLDTSVAHARADYELSRGGQQAKVTQVLPVFNPPDVLGVLKPGQLLAVNEASQVDVGMVDSVTVSAQLQGDALVVRQSVALIRHYYD